MIGLKKGVLKGVEKRGKAVFSSFGEKEGGAGCLRPASYGNCDCRGGVLRGGIGLKKYLDQNGNHMEINMTNGTVLYIFVAPLNKDGLLEDTTAIYAVGLDGYLYLRNENGWAWQRVLVGNYVTHSALRGENKEIYNFYSGDKSTYSSSDGQVFRNVINEKVHGGCVCNKRYVVLTKKGEIRYMGVLKPYSTDSENSDGAGVIYAPAGFGAPVGIKGYGENAYVFFERGIFKLTLSATGSEHTLQRIPYLGGTICMHAQATTSDGVIFLAREGVYYLRNDRVERICEYLPIGPCVPSKISNVGYCDDTVIFSYHQEKGNTSEVKRLVVYADGKDGYFAELNGPLGGSEYTCIQGKIYRYAKDYEGVEYKAVPFYTSEELDFGTARKKRLKYLTLKGEGSVSVVVKSGDFTRTYPLVFKDGVAKTRLFDSGKIFSLTFQLETGAVVESVEIDYLTEG